MGADKRARECPGRRLGDVLLIGLGIVFAAVGVVLASITAAGRAVARTWRRHVRR